jgi:Flp pilus assembly secretin CpaC
MTRKIALSLVGMIAAIGFGTSDNARAAEPQIDALVVSSSATSRFVPLGLGKSVVIDLPADAKEVLIGNPKIVLATLRSNRRAYLTGGEVGETNVYFFGPDGRQISALDVAVASTPALRPPVLENSTIIAQVIDVYYGAKEVMAVYCSRTRCTAPPKEPPPPNNTVIYSNSTYTSNAGTSTSSSTSTSSR